MLCRERKLGEGELTGGWKPNYLGERGHCTLELPDKKIAASRLFSREPPVHVCSWSIDASPLHVRCVPLSSDEQHQPLQAGSMALGESWPAVGGKRV